MSAMTWDRIARRQAGIITRAQFVAGWSHRRSSRRDWSWPSELSWTPGSRGVYRAAGAPDTRECRGLGAVLGASVPCCPTCPPPSGGSCRSRVTAGSTSPASNVSSAREHTAWCGYTGPPLDAARDDARGSACRSRPAPRPCSTAWVGCAIGTARTCSTARSSSTGWRRSRSSGASTNNPGGGEIDSSLSCYGQSRPGAEAESERRLQSCSTEPASPAGPATTGRSAADGFVSVSTLPSRYRKVAIEVDGWAFHRSKERRDRDMVKANALIAAGWRLSRSAGRT